VDFSMSFGLRAIIQPITGDLGQSIPDLRSYGPILCEEAVSLCVPPSSGYMRSFLPLIGSFPFSAPLAPQHFAGIVVGSTNS
jgi:hypothetical protein